MRSLSVLCDDVTSKVFTELSLEASVECSSKHESASDAIRSLLFDLSPPPPQPLPPEDTPLPSDSREDDSEPAPSAELAAALVRSDTAPSRAATPIDGGLSNPGEPPRPDPQALRALASDLISFAEHWGPKHGSNVQPILATSAAAEVFAQCVEARGGADAALFQARTIATIDDLAPAQATVEAARARFNQVKSLSASEDPAVERRIAEIGYPACVGAGMCEVERSVREAEEAVKGHRARLESARRDLEEAEEGIEMDVKAGRWSQALEKAQLAQTLSHAVEEVMRPGLLAGLRARAVVADRGVRATGLEREAEGIEEEAMRLASGGKFDQARSRAADAGEVRRRAMAVWAEEKAKPGEDGYHEDDGGDVMENGEGIDAGVANLGGGVAVDGDRVDKEDGDEKGGDDEYGDRDFEGEDDDAGGQGEGIGGSGGEDKVAVEGGPDADAAAQGEQGKGEDEKGYGEDEFEEAD
jgi:hypothetical protein